MHIFIGQITLQIFAVFAVLVSSTKMYLLLSFIMIITEVTDMNSLNVMQWDEVLSQVPCKYSCINICVSKYNKH